MNNFAKNISYLLKDWGMTYKVSKDLNIKTNTLYCYKSGLRFPKLDNLISLAKYFKITLDELVLGELWRG